MGFEFRRPFQLETKRLICLLSLVFGTMVLYHRIEIPTTNALWSKFTQRTNNIYSLENLTSMSNSPTIVTRHNDLAFPPPEHANFSLTLDESYVAPPVVNNVSKKQPRPIHIHPSKNRSSKTNLSSIEIRNNEPPKEANLNQRGNSLQRKAVLTVLDMNELLVESHFTPNSMIRRWSTKADEELVTSKSLIETGGPLINGLYAPLYHNASMFQRSYELMEKMLKVYIYQEGDSPIFHTPLLEGIYASKGWFMKLLETNTHFVTNRPDEAHLFYLPFSCKQLREMYIPRSRSTENLVQYLKNYLDMISAKYPFWNRTDGADHFLVACHDWASSETKRDMSNCIRALCNANVKNSFNFGKDVSFPTTYVRKAENPLSNLGGKAPSKRKTLAFYAGNMHGYVPPILLQYWGNNTDPDMQIFGKLPTSKGNKNYIEYMKSSKYCICPRGYEVNSPRVVEAIFYECVPVIISDNYVPPLFETLNWESFAVFVAQRDIPDLKKILVSIPEKTYFRMHMRVRKVQQHFLWHTKPVKYDLFHMTLHSIWYNRVFQFRPDEYVR